MRSLSRVLPSRKGILGINGRNIECIYPLNRRKFFPNVDEKLRCKELLVKEGVPVPKTYYVVDGPASLAAWENKLEGIDKFVIKPNRGYGGGGILLVRRVADYFYGAGYRMQAEDITFHVLQICNGAFAIDNISDNAYFEETITNHPGLAHFLSEGVEGVADIRVIYKFDRPVMAMLRIPTRESEGKANLHQGGVGVGIDLETGLSLYGCYRNKIVERHPESGAELKGSMIPHFREMLASGAHISKIVGLGYIGVDFVCDRSHGPLVLEVNARPGLNIQIANQAGLRKRLE